MVVNDESKDMKVFEINWFFFWNVSTKYTKIESERVNERTNERTMSSSDSENTYTEFLATWRKDNSYSEDEWEAHIELIMEVLQGEVEGVEIDEDLLTSSEYTAVYRALHGK